MISVVRRDVRSVLRDRRVVRRSIVGASVLLVAIAVLANTVWRPTNVVVERTPDARVNAEADAVAQSFTRVFLSADPANSRAREQQLAQFGSESRSWGMSWRKGAVKRRVTSTQVAGVTVRADNGDRIVTVQAQLSTGTVTALAVRTRSVDGQVRIVGAPAVVGAPAIGKAIEERETSGGEAPGEVREVVERAMRHLLAGRQGDLAPDLAPGAAVSIPDQPLTLSRVASATWVKTPSESEGSVQTRVVAIDDDDIELTLDYELDLVRTGQGRWQLLVVHIPGQEPGLSQGEDG